MKDQSCILSEVLTMLTMSTLFLLFRFMSFLGQIWLEFNQELNYDLFKVLTCTIKKGSSSSFGEKNNRNINTLKTFHLQSYAMILLLVQETYYLQMLCFLRNRDIYRASDTIQ